MMNSGEAQKTGAPAALARVALLGRPNVGKSTLFNRLIRSNRAITHDRPGITRDRMEGIVRSKGSEPFLLVDTGGVTLDEHARVQDGPAGIRGFEMEILEQAREALAESDLLCLVVDGREGLTPFDSHLADYLRKAGKPLLLVINKIDGPEKKDILLAEFHSLGLDMLACSAAHGYNVRALEEEMRERLYPQGDAAPDISPEDAGLLLEGATRRQKKRLLADARAALLDDAANEADDTTPGSPDDAAAADDMVDADEAFDPADADDFFEGPGDDAAFDCDDEASDGSAQGAEAACGASGELLQYAESELAEEVAEGDDDVPYYASPKSTTGPLRLALLGRPNAGKSSLVNALSGSKRMIVSDVAGTTRDSVDVTAQIEGEPVTFVDTAGVRRRAKIVDTVERFSVNSSLKSTTKAHVTLLVLNADEGLTQQDKRLIDLLHERKTPFMLLINKSDLIDHKKRKEAETLYREALSFCPHVPLLFVSALNRHNLRVIVPTARAIRHECGIRVPTGRLNRAIAAVLERHQPPVVRNARPKFFYLTQAESLPPTFVLFVSDAERVLPSYARYIERSLRKMFGITHAPMRVNFRSSHTKKTRKR